MLRQPLGGLLDVLRLEAFDDGHLLRATRDLLWSETPFYPILAVVFKGTSHASGGLPIWVCLLLTVPLLGWF